ncbi:MAG TPA: hypothetical protein PLR74_17050, partial [Agriterribacter sp.]|nr:hypothetical protein [Agriterribacter sp.]
ASGEWFRKKYKVTPATAVTVNNDLNGSDKKTVWFNSRFYRFNLLWENNTLRFRDIHIFNENFPSVYTTQRATSNDCAFFTLPFFDGYRWSSADKPAALRFRVISNGKAIPIEGGTPIISDDVPGKLHIEWPLTSANGTLFMDADEEQIEIKIAGNKTPDWFLDLSAGDTASLPFTAITPHTIHCRFEGMDYRVEASKGNFVKPAGDAVIRIRPDKGTVVLHFAQQH